MIQDGECRSRKPPGSRKTLPDFIERRETFVMESFESLFHEYLDRPDLAGIAKFYFKNFSFNTIFYLISQTHFN